LSEKNLILLRKLHVMLSPDIRTLWKFPKVKMIKLGNWKFPDAKLIIIYISPKIANFKIEDIKSKIFLRHVPGKCNTSLLKLK
jgi:hypothetical protein